MDDRTLTAIMVLVGVPATLVGYILVTEAAMRRLPARTAARLRPWLWVSPAIAFLVVFLVYPTLDTIRRSFLDHASEAWVGLDNYLYFFTTEGTLTALRNNVMWLVLLTAITVGLGLLIAVLVDRVRYESLAKSVIFLPMAISFVAASVIWRFVYDYRPPGAPQTGTLNAIVTSFGRVPIAFLQESPWNNLALIVVGGWMMTGFAMVILSAGLKAINPELMEAARVDGASEWVVFRRVILPLLLPTIAVVSTTIVIFALKAFDIVYIMTNGNFDTEVIANRMFKELFTFSQFGRAAAIAVILLMAIVPVMLGNIRRFREQEAIR
jgi:alpha-glucoside transport system permease protein